MGEDIWNWSANKGLMSRIYKKLLHTISKSQAQDMNRHFSKETYRWQTDT